MVTVFFTCIIFSAINIRVVMADDQETFSEVSIKSPYFSVPNSKKDYSIGPSIATIKTIPAIQRVEANYVKNGRITTQTTDIRVYMNTAIELEGSDRPRTTVYYLSQLNSDDTVKELVSGEHFGSNSDNNIGRIRTEFKNCKFSSLDGMLPLYITERFNTTNGDAMNKYGYAKLGTFNKNNNANLTPTIFDGLTGDSMVLSGTGTTVGDTITSNLSDDKTTVKQQANGEKTYQLQLSKKLSEYLLTHDYVEVTESNDNGDSGVSRKVSQLKLTESEPQPEFYLDDLSNLQNDDGSEMDDKTVIKKLRDKFKIKSYGTDLPDEAYTYDTDEKGETLVNQIKGLKNGQTLNIKIYAKQAGSISSAPVNVKILYQPGILSFNLDQTEMNFKSQPVPLIPQIFWYDQTWYLKIDDNRHQRDGWKLTAKAAFSAKQQAQPEMHDLSKYLYYQDDSGGEHSLATQEVEIHTDSEQKAVTNMPYIVQLSFNETNKKGAGIFVKGSPDMYAGNYGAQITWTLNITPTTTA